MATEILSLSGSNTGYVVNLTTGTYAAAATVLPIGDSLTHGYLTPSADDPDLATREGYRGDLFNLILAAGGWIDYVGSTQNGPEDMLDPDHSATGGEELWQIVANDGILSDLSDNLGAHAPDITLLMAGTNDFGTQQFENRFGRIIENMGKAIDQFESYAGGDEKYLVISTLAPKIRDGIPAEYADMINRGYSVVDGALVAGNAGNGTYLPGLIALVEGANAGNPNIILFNNPVGLGDLSDDEVHYTDAGYAKYAAALMTLLESEVGLVDGTFAGNGQTTDGALSVEGGDAGDRIIGNDQSNTIEGGGGRDHITLGGGADTVVYGASALDDMRDLVTDLTAADTIDLSGIAAALGLDAAALEAALLFDEDNDGTEMAVNTAGGTVRLAYFDGATEALVRGAISIDGSDVGGGDGNDSTGNDGTGNDGTGNDGTGNDSTGNDGTGNDGTGNDGAGNDGTGNDDVTGQLLGTSGNDILVDDGDATEIIGFEGRDTIYGGDGDDIIEGGEGKDNLYGGAGGDTFRFTQADGDGQRDNILDFSVAEGDRIDITALGVAFGLTSQQLQDIIDIDFIGNGIRVSFSHQDFTENLAILKGLTAGDVDGVIASIVTEISGGGSDEPDEPEEPEEPADLSADADGNLAITVPDTYIDETEAQNVVIAVSGIDADATAVVSMTLGGTTLTRSLAADGTVSFDLSALPDGAYATAVTVTDTSFNQATANGATVTLATPEPEPEDTTADEGGDLDVVAPDTVISPEEAASVAFEVSGLDADATARIVVSDGTSSVTETGIASNGTVTLDLSGLASGNLTVRISASDTSGNTTGLIAGPVIVLEEAPEPADPPAGGGGIEIPDDLPELVGTNGNDQLKDGSAGSLILGLDGNDKLFGQGGDDFIVGGEGNDTLRGDGGDDVLIGGAGKDILRGKSGADTFVFGLDDLDGNKDRIDTWNSAEGDKINMSEISNAYGWSAAEAASYISFSSVSNGVNVNLNAPEVSQALFKAFFIELGDISVDDFVFT